VKIYVMTDLEGVAGVYQWENREDQSQENLERRCRQRRWLADEVNAAVEGFFSAGATEVIVNDGHGAGYTIDMDRLDPRVTVINGRERPSWLPYLDETCDAAAFVGAHAKASTSGACLCHTMDTTIKDWTFNDISLGEMGIQAAIAGHYGVPFIFASGDAYACLEIKKLIPQVVTAPVKIGLSQFSACHLSRERAQNLIRKGAKESCSVLGNIEPFNLKSPVAFMDKRKNPTFDRNAPLPHSDIIDPCTRRIVANDIIDLMHKIYGYPMDWRPMDFCQQWKQVLS